MRAKRPLSRSPQTLGHDGALSAPEQERDRVVFPRTFGPPKGKAKGRHFVELGCFTQTFFHKKIIVNLMPDNPQATLNIELPEDVAEGIYSNLAIISHSNAEFVVDFIRMMPNVPKARVKSRIILTPQHAKRLLFALKDNIHKYEMQFGKIEEPEHPQLPPMNFNTPPAQA